MDNSCDASNKKTTVGRGNKNSKYMDRIADGDKTPLAVASNKNGNNPDDLDVKVKTGSLSYRRLVP